MTAGNMVCCIGVPLLSPIMGWLGEKHSRLHWVITLCCVVTSLALSVSSLSHRNIVSKCPGMAGTVQEFRPMSRPCPGWHKTVLMSQNFTNLVRLELGVPIIPHVVSRKTCRCARTSSIHYFEHKSDPRLIFIVCHAVFSTPTTNFDLKFSQKLILVHVVANGGVVKKFRTCSKHVPVFWFPNLATMLALTPIPMLCSCCHCVTWPWPSLSL